MNFLVSLLAGLVLTLVLTVILAALGRVFQLWRVLPERTVLVYTFFGKVVGQVDELAAKGVTFIQEPQKADWGTAAIFADPDGNQFVLGSG